jgi:hypothetical protein
MCTGQRGLNHDLLPVYAYQLTPRRLGSADI